MAELLNNMERAENHLLELVLGVKDAATAEAAEQSIFEALQRRSEAYERVSLVLGTISAPIETPARRKTADALEKRLQELRNLPQPFYGNKTLKRVLTWGRETRCATCLLLRREQQHAGLLREGPADGEAGGEE